jgi:hypothetical protein
MRIVTIATPASIDNKTTKVKRLKEDEVCVWFFFCLGCVLWWALFLYAFVKLRIFFNHQESNHYMQIKHNREFILQTKKLHHNFI